MPRTYRLYLQDIVDAARFIESQVKGLEYEVFVSDELRLSAVLHKLTVIGEAVKHIPDDIRQLYPEVPWREIAGTRNVIVHGYFLLNLPLIWQAVTVEVPELRQQIEVILQDIADEQPERSGASPGRLVKPGNAPREEEIGKEEEEDI